MGCCITKLKQNPQNGSKVNAMEVSNRIFAQETLGQIVDPSTKGKDNDI